MEPKLDSLKSEDEFAPQKQGQWEHLNNVLPKFEMSEPAAAANDLEAEIRQAQAQLSQLKKQRELIDIQQKVAEETRELELARNRLLATTNKAKKTFSPATPASTPSKDTEPKNKARNEGPQKKPCLARNEPAASSIRPPDRRPSEPQTPKPAPPKAPQPKPSPSSKTAKNNISNLSLDQLRALAAASRSPAGAAQTDKNETNEPPVRPFNPPTQPATHASAPPVPNVGVYNGRALGEFKNYTLGLERHFDRYPDWYKIEEHKVTRALKHVALSLEDEWRRHMRNQPSDKNTYANLCTFLIHQINKGVPPEQAKSRYHDSFQRPAQTVTDFSNWMQQWEPHFNNNNSERDRMRHLFEHLLNRVRNEADKTHLDFDNYADFVEYLQRVEDSIEGRGISHGRNGRDNNPRKRSRHD
jgi:hypothetical protein